MSGDWIKMECCTPEKSEVLAVTARLGWDDADLTVGKLFRLWRWFDQHTADGNADGVTAALLDRIVGVSGFCEALTQVGWLCITERGISLPNFDRHNGNTAKNRAQTAKRVAKHKSNAKANDQGNARTVTTALPREEKRREDIPTTDVVGGGAKPKATRKCPDWFEVTPSMRAWATENAPLVDVDLATAKLRDHTFKTAITDWLGAWRNWLRRDQESAESRKPGTPKPQSETFRERDERLARERIAAVLPDIAAKPAARLGEVIDAEPIFRRIEA